MGVVHVIQSGDETITITTQDADPKSQIKLNTQSNYEKHLAFYYDDRPNPSNAVSKLHQDTSSKAEDWMSNVLTVSNFVRDNFGVHISCDDDFVDFCVLTHLYLYCRELWSVSLERMQEIADAFGVYHTVYLDIMREHW